MAGASPSTTMPYFSTGKFHCITPGSLASPFPPFLELAAATYARSRLFEM